MSAQTSASAVTQRRSRDLAGSFASVIARPWVWVAVLTLLGFLLRRYHLGSESLWFDEADIVERARQSLPTLLEGFTKAGENGPLYTLMLHFWLAAISASPLLERALHVVFGHNQEALVRGLAAIFGTAAIPLMYGLGWRVGGPLLGLLSAGLLTFNPFHIWHSQDAKMYTLLVFMTLASSLLYLRALDHNSVRLWLGYVVSTWIMLTVHSMAGLVLLAQIVATPFLLGIRDQGSGIRDRGSGAEFSDPRPLIPDPRFRLVRWSWAMLLILIPVLPIVWLRAAALFEGADVGGWYTPTGLTDIIGTIFVKFAVNQATPPWEAIGSISMGVLALLGSIGLLRVNKQLKTQNHALERSEGSKLKTHYLVFSLWLTPILAFWAVTLKLPLFQPRYLIMALPAYLILAAAGLLALKRVHTALAVAGAILLGLPTIWALAGVNYSAQAQKEDWRGAIGYMQDHLRLRDAIVVFPGYMETSVNYYYRAGGPGDVPQVDVKTIPSLLTKGFGANELNETLWEAVTCHERAWVVTSPVREAQEDPQHQVREWFQYNWHTFDTQVFNGVTVYGIAFNGQPRCWFPEPDHKEPHSFTNGLDFQGYIYELRRKDNTQPDASYFPLTLYWRAQHKLDQDYQVRVMIKDPSGKLVVDEALGALNGYWPTSQWPPNTQIIDYRDLRLPGGLKPGDYTISLQLYPKGQPDQLLNLKEGGSEIVLKAPLSVVPWKP